MQHLGVLSSFIIIGLNGAHVGTFLRRVSTNSLYKVVETKIYTNDYYQYF